MKNSLKKMLVGFFFLVIIPNGIAAETTAVDHALQILHRYMKAFNAKDWEVWRLMHHNPNFYIGPNSETIVFDMTKQSQPFFLSPEVLKTGWNYTDWDSSKIVQRFGNNIQVETQFTLYRGNGCKLVTYNISYFINKQDERWGIAGRLIDKPQHYDLSKKTSFKCKIMQMLKVISKPPI